MSMSDCEKCWDTPCRCGHDYRNWSVEALKKQIEMLQRVLSERRKKDLNEQKNQISSMG